MLTLSQKAIELPSSPIRRLVSFADAATERGIQVFHLNIGQPDIASPQCAIDAIRNIELDHFPYCNSAGILSYRKGLAKYYNNLGIDISYNDLMITTGGSEAVNFAIAITCNPGDEIIVMEPYYTNYNTFAKLNDVKLVPVRTSIEDGFAMPPIEEFEKVITPKTKGILMCNPGNPAGVLYTKESVEQLGKIIKKHNIYLYADEVYREFCYTDEPHFSALKLKDVDDNVILIDSVSKRYSMCGIRIGALVTRNKEFIKALLKYCQARLCSPRLSQIAAEAALATPQSYFDDVRKEYIHRRDILLGRLKNMKGVVCPTPKGAFYAVAKLPVDDAEIFAKWLLTDFVLDKKTVMVTPAAGFYTTPNEGKNQVRLAYVLKEKDLNQALDCLEEALKVYPGRVD